MYWKNAWWVGTVYSSCEPIELPEGMIISKQFEKYPISVVSKAIYKQLCYRNCIPVLNTNVGFVIDTFAKPLPIVTESWREFTRDSLRGSFAYSVVSIIYAIAVLAVIIWFLTIFVLTNYTIKPSWLLKTSTILSTVYILVVVIKSILILHGQQRDGYLHGAKLLSELNDYNPIQIIDLIVVLLLQINQVQIIMRIFQRQKDKRMALLIGIVATLASQVIWAIAQFYTPADANEASDILPAFIYLVRIAMALCYAAIITVFFISKIQIILANKKIWLLTLLTFILIYSPVAFFVADVSNAFVYELSEIFSVVNYVIGVVIPWEWCNKFNLIMKAKEKEGVLGRRFYEDELYELDRFELFVEEQIPEDEDNIDTHSDPPDNELNGGAHHNNQEQREGLIRRNSPTNKLHGDDNDNDNSVPALKFRRILTTTKDAFLTLTDNIIAAGFAIPRSVSVSTQSLTGRHRNNSTTHAEYTQEVVPDFCPEMFLHPEGNSHIAESSSEQNAAPLTTTNSNHRRRNVYVYSRKEVILDVSSDE